MFTQDNDKQRSNKARTEIWGSGREQKKASGSPLNGLSTEIPHRRTLWGECLKEEVRAVEKRRMSLRGE